MLDGDPGQGKSWITVEVTSKLSTGKKLPGQRKVGEPRRVLILATEDDIADTIKPRLMAQGANLDNIRIYQGGLLFDSIGAKRLNATIEEWKPDLIVIDPVVSYVGGKLDINRANEVREILDRLDLIAREHGCAVLIVRHTRKARSGSAMDAGMGSRDFGAKVRSGLIAGKDVEGMYVLAHYKHSTTQGGLSLGYEIVEAPDTFLGSRLRWVGAVSTQADDLVVAPVNESRGSKLDEAKAFLLRVLKDGPAPAKSISSAAYAEGITEVTLKRAKKDLGIISEMDGDRWFWSMTE